MRFLILSILNLFALDIFSQIDKNIYYTLPFDIITPKTNYSECLRLKEAITDEPLKYDESKLSYYYLKGNKNAYKLSYISTKEFEDRYFTYCTSAMLKIYIENTDKNLWETDLKVVDFLKKQLRNDSLYLIKSGDVPVEYIKDYLSHYKTLIAAFENFASQKYTMPVVIDYSLINWKDSKELTKHLKSYKIPNHKINEMIFFIESRKKPDITSSPTSN